MGEQILGGSVLAVVGFLGTIIICALPKWRITEFSGANNVTDYVLWEGLWTNCVTQGKDQMQCKTYDSILALPQDLQAARALVVIAIMICVFGVLLGIAGSKCTNFVEGERAKARVAIAAGIVFICAGVLILIPVFWSANTITTDFHNPVLINPQKRYLGAALFIAQGIPPFLILGGALFCGLPCPGSTVQDSIVHDFLVSYGSMSEPVHDDHHHGIMIILGIMIWTGDTRRRFL